MTVGTATFGLLPDFVGFFLVMKGMEELTGENEFFDRGRHVAFGLLIVSVLIYAADLMNPDAMTRVWLWALELAALAAQLMLLRMMISGIGRMANDYKLDLRCERLRTMWLVLVVMHPICHLVSWVPLVGSVCGVVSTAMGVCFLIAMYGTRKRFLEFEQ